MKKNNYQVDKELQNSIERNYREAWNTYNIMKEERLIKLEEQKKKDRILAIFIGLFIIIATCLLISKGI